MILGFKQNFVLPIIDGRKIHSIRQDKHSRWEPGRKIHMATQVRTKNMDIFAIFECKSVQHIVFVWTEIHGLFDCHIFIDGALIPPTIMEQLAKNDGFESVEAFLKWEAWDKKNFTGRLIHWTEKKY